MNIKYRTYEAIFENISIAPRISAVAAMMDAINHGKHNGIFLGLLERGHCADGHAYSEDVRFISRKLIVSEMEKLARSGEIVK